MYYLKHYCCYCYRFHCYQQNSEQVMGIWGIQKDSLTQDKHRVKALLTLAVTQAICIAMLYVLFKCQSKYQKET